MTNSTYLLTDYDLRKFEEIESLLLIVANGIEDCESYDIESGLRGVLSLIGSAVENVRSHCEVNKGGKNA